MISRLVRGRHHLLVGGGAAVTALGQGRVSPVLCTALTGCDGNGQTQQLQARRRDNQGSETPAEAWTPSGRKPGPDRQSRESRVKGSKAGWRRETNERGHLQQQRARARAQGSCAHPDLLRRAQPRPWRSRFPRWGTWLMRSRCEWHHRWAGCWPAPPPRCPCRTKGLTREQGVLTAVADSSLHKGTPSLGAPTSRDLSGHDYTTAQGLLPPSPVPLAPPEPSVHSPTFPGLPQNPP